VADAGGERLGLRGYPNPFRASTTLTFELPDSRAYGLRVYDAGGRLVRVLGSGTVGPTGRNAVPWDGRDAERRPVAAGVYFSRLDLGDRREVVRLLVVR
jgi:hypothetical protein